MCINFRAPKPEEMTATFSAPVIDTPEWPEEVWQDYAAPIVTGNGNCRDGSLATYGMIPQKRIPAGVRKFSTMNARAETIGEKRSFSRAWKDGQRCLVPLRHFYEPNWETGKAERWKIGMADGSLFAVAGIWREWKTDDDAIERSFTQLTINSDDHELMSRFHRPGDEKRSLIILPRDHWDDWLECGDPEVARTFFRLYPAELMAAEPAPRAPRKSKQTEQAPSLFDHHD